MEKVGLIQQICIYTYTYQTIPLHYIYIYMVILYIDTLYCLVVKARAVTHKALLANPAQVGGVADEVHLRRRPNFGYEYHGNIMEM